MSLVLITIQEVGYNSGDDDLPMDYCFKCHCLKRILCRFSVWKKIVLIVYKQQCSINVKEGQEGMTLEGITNKVFKKNYVEMVFSKMVINKCIYTIDSMIKQHIAVPKCIIRHSLRQYLSRNKVEVGERRTDHQSYLYLIAII